MGYCLFRNVNALLMFFISPIFFWYPPRYPLATWATFAAIAEDVHSTSNALGKTEAAVLSSRLSTWHTIFTPCEDVVNKVVTELGTAKTMCEPPLAVADGIAPPKAAPTKVSCCSGTLQWLFAQKSGVGILLGVYMLLTAITQYETAQIVYPPVRRRGPEPSACPPQPRALMHPALAHSNVVAGGAAADAAQAASWLHAPLHQ